MNWDRFTGKAIYLDTNIVIFAVEARGPWSDQLRPLFNKLDSGSIHGITSELTIAEAMARPIALGDEFHRSRFEDLFSSNSVLEMHPVDRTVLTLAAEIRGKQKLKLFDAIHVATARLAQCDHFFTQDERLRRAIGSELHWLRLPESN